MHALSPPLAPVVTLLLRWIRMKKKDEFSAACEIEKKIVRAENGLEKNERRRWCGRAFQRARA